VAFSTKKVLPVNEVLQAKEARKNREHIACNNCSELGHYSRELTKEQGTSS